MTVWPSGLRRQIKALVFGRGFESHSGHLFIFLLFALFCFSPHEGMAECFLFAASGNYFTWALSSTKAPVELFFCQVPGRPVRHFIDTPDRGGENPNHEECSGGRALQAGAINMSSCRNSKSTEVSLPCFIISCWGL